MFFIWDNLKCTSCFWPCQAFSGSLKSVIWPWIIRCPERKVFILSALLTTPKPLTVWITKNWKIFKEMGIPDHLTCLLRNLHADQEATVRTGHGITDWFQIRKGVHPGWILSRCLFNLYAQYTMGDVRLDEAQGGIKIARRNTNNLRYASDTKWQKTKKF